MNAFLPPLAPARDEVGAQSAQTRHWFAGIVAVEGGGSRPHPEGGGTVSRVLRESPGRLW
jgi:hypothetical protein